MAELESFLPYEFYPQTDKSISLPALAVLKIRSVVDTALLAELYQQTLSAVEQDPKHIFFTRIFFFKFEPQKKPSKIGADGLVRVHFFQR